MQKRQQVQYLTQKRYVHLHKITTVYLLLMLLHPLVVLSLRLMTGELMQFIQAHKNAYPVYMDCRHFRLVKKQ